MRKALPTIFAVLTILLTVVLPSCNDEDPIDIGQGIFEGTENPDVNFTADQTITAKMVVTPPFETGFISESGIARPYLLGEITEDPVFGSSFAGIYAMMAPQETFIFGADDLRFDSLYLFLDYENVAAYGDSSALQNIVVYEMAEKIDTLNLFTNADYAIKENEMGRLSDFKFSPLEESILGADTSDSRMAFNLSEYMRDQDLLGELFVDVLRDSLDSTFHDGSLFKDFFNGVYIMPDTSLNNNAMVQMNMGGSNSAILLYYSDLQADVESQARVHSFGVTDTCLVTNRFQHDYSVASDPSIQTILQSASQVMTDEVYLQGYGGLQMELEFPEIEDLGSILVNKAELVFTHVHSDDNEDDIYPPAISFDYFTIENDPDTGESTYAFVDDYFINPDPVIEVDEESDPITTTYTFNINQHIQRLANGTLDAPELRVSISTLALPAEKFFISPDEYARNRVVLGGPENTDEKLRMKLNLFYTNIP